MSQIRKVAYGLLVVVLLGLPFATPAAADGAPPTAPAELQGDLVGGDIVLSWPASTDDGTVDGYNVYRDNVYISTVQTTSFSEPNDGQSHTYYVTAFDNKPRLFSGRSPDWTFRPESPTTTTTTTTPTVVGPTLPPTVIISPDGEKPVPDLPPVIISPDGEKPVPDLPPVEESGPLNAPTGLVGTATIDGIRLSWTATPDSRVEGYNIYGEQGQHLATSPDTEWASQDYTQGTFSVAAFGAGLYSPRSATTIEPRPRAIVSLGDSFISGMGSRWRGNSREIPAETDLGMGVYAAGGCHQSSGAEVHSAQIAGLDTFNFACAGATTADVAGQTILSAGLAETHDIEMIVVSIGGNDLNFAGRLARCAERFLGHKRPCYKRWSGTSLPNDIATTLRPNVSTALTTIRQTMRAAGVEDDSYRLVLQSYPSPLPDGPRYSSSRKWRGRGGCPFHSEDIRWVHRNATPMIDQALREVAASSPGVEFLSLKNAFKGKEVCAQSLEHVTPSNLDQPEKHEWVRWGAADVKYHLIPSRVEQGGSIGEAFHPNAYGQQALGRCLRLVWEAQNSNYHSCTNNGTIPTNMSLSRS